MGFAELIQRAWRDNVLWSVLFELTYRCNLSCFFCYNDLELEGRPLTLADYRRAIDELADLQVMNLILTGGEPLAHPDFLAIAGHGRRRGFALRIKSNGHALTGPLARRIRDEIDPFVIDVSLHGATAEVHDRQTRVQGSFDRLRANLESARALGLRLKINATLTRWNEAQIEGMYAVADDLDIPLSIHTEVTARDNGDRSPLQLTPSREGIRRLFEVQHARAARAARTAQATEAERLPPTAPGTQSGKYCGAGSSSLAVDPYGNVFPCVQWRVPIGNLHEQSFGALWEESPALARVRDETQVVESTIQATPGGRQMAFCPGAAHAATGDATRIHEAPKQRAAALARDDLSARQARLPVLG